MRSGWWMFLLSSVFKTCTCEDWCYQSQVSCETACKGPGGWRELNDICGSNRQSPINIVTRKTKPDCTLAPFRLIGYKKTFTSTLNNNGHTVKIEVPHRAMLSGGKLKHVYKAVQLHFHWGNRSGPGSEHTLDGEQYPMEMHIVHMKKEYVSLDEALHDPSGLAVLAFFFTVSTRKNRKYNALIEALKNVQDADTETKVAGTSLIDLILSEHELVSYYRYEGSLTTPGCSEAVIWTVFKHPITLSEQQLAAFSSLKFRDGSPMVGTFRPVQPPRGRPVYRSCSSSAAAAVGSLALLLLSVSAALGLCQGLCQLEQAAQSPAQLHHT